MIMQFASNMMFIPIIIHLTNKLAYEFLNIYQIYNTIINKYNLKNLLF